jgi:hypothetical protein
MINATQRNGKATAMRLKKEQAARVQRPFNVRSTKGQPYRYRYRYYYYCTLRARSERSERFGCKKTNGVLGLRSIQTRLKHRRVIALIRKHQSYLEEFWKVTFETSLNRLIRGIETYQKYVDRGDIVELDWNSFKNQPYPDLGSVKLLFEATQYKPIMLINATAQVALTHHLDDEVSKNVSVHVEPALEPVMSNLATQNPLFQPVQYQGGIYFTSQYFHQQYHANKPDGGKYAQLKDFNRLVRGIETYQDYVERGDIIELDKAGADFAPALKELFRLTFGKPIMLINATAQVALTHHLDDEVSKNVSVAVNSNAVNQQPAQQLIDLNDAASLRLALINYSTKFSTGSCRWLSKT